MQEVTAAPTAFLVSWQSYGCRAPQVPGVPPGAGSSKERWLHLSPPPSLHIPPHNPPKKWQRWWSCTWDGDYDVDDREVKWTINCKDRQLICFNIEERQEDWNLNGRHKSDNYLLKTNPSTVKPESIRWTRFHWCSQSYCALLCVVANSTLG